MSRFSPILEKLLIAVFCFSMPFGTRLAIWHAAGGFFPYNTIFIYGTDILILMMIVNWLAAIPFSEISKDFTRSYRLQALSFLAFLCVGVVSAIQSESPMISFFILGRLTMFAAFALLLAARISVVTASWLALPVFLSGVFQSAVGIFQFAAQRNIGLTYLGENMLGPGMAGVAKIEVFGEKLIRSYGTFPHPNILAAFLLMTLFISIWAYSENGSIIFGKFAILNDFPVFRNIAWLGGITAMLVALLMTFSRSAWIVGSLASICWGTLLIFQRHLISHDAKLRLASLGLIAITFLGFCAIFFSNEIRGRNALQIQDQAVQERIHGVYWAAQMLNTKKLFGIGPGQFTAHIERYSGSLPETWMYQPVHTVYLLVAAEFGVLGLGAFLVFLGFIARHWLVSIKNNSMIISASCLGIFIAFMLLGLFDHYFLSFEQGVALFWIAVMFMLTSRDAKGHNHAIDRIIA